MSSRGLFFLSCNDVIYLDFHLPVFVHNLIIVKYDIKSKHAEEYSTANKEGSEKPLASRIITSSLFLYLKQIKLVRLLTLLGTVNCHPV